MKCSTCRQLIKKYFNQLLSQKEQYQMDDHINNCAECRRFMAEEQSMMQALQSLPKIKPTDDLKSNIWKAIDHRKMNSQPVFRGSSFGKIVTVAGAVAVAALILLPKLFINAPVEKKTVVSQSNQEPKKIGGQVDQVLLKAIVESDETTMDMIDKTKKRERSKVPVHKEVMVKKVLDKPLNEPESGGVKKRRMITSHEITKKRKKSSSLSVARKSGYKNDIDQKKSVSAAGSQDVPKQNLSETGGISIKIFNNIINVNNGEQFRLSMVLEQESDVSIYIFSRSGRLTRKISDGRLNNGEHEWIWTGKDDKNQRVSSGVYFVICQINGKTVKKEKIIVIK